MSSQRAVCNTLSVAALKRLGISNARTHIGDLATLPTCTWDDHDDFARNLELSFSTLGGLDMTYANHREDPSLDAYWEPMTIDGYPAVRRATSDQRSIGVCGMDIGVSDRVLAHVAAAGMKNKNGCYRQLAAAAIAVIEAIK